MVLLVEVGLSCENCHNDELFPKEGKVEGMNMKELAKGKWCGKCHNKVSFFLANCKRCHSLVKKASMEKVANEQERSAKKKLRSAKMEEAKKRQLENMERQRKAKEAWLKLYKEHSIELKEIAPKAEMHERPDTPKEMVYIPAGRFLRGQDWGENEDIKPSKVIEMSPYYIDRLEVTVADYKAYSKAAKKRTPYHLRDKDLGGDNQPVFKMYWQEASDYCSYYGKRLPTESEWEKAARGLDNRYFAWGNELPDAGDKYRANYDPGRRFEDGYRYTSDVGTFNEGASPFGALDMTGNLWEWTSDWYAADYYSGDESKDPQGPDKGEKKVIRGGAFNTKVKSLLLTTRLPEKPKSRKNYIGFRCAKSME